ncbi:MAG: hypothetical protein AB1898_07085 [Acidobacteriota bacterium]
MRRFWIIPFTFSFLYAVAAQVMSSAPQDGSSDLRVSAVEAFMSARTLNHNVEARKLMTASLENEYLKSKRLSVRVRSGRVVAFTFDLKSLTVSGDDEFQVTVESLWADLNEQVSATQVEKLKFVKFRNEWLADKIEFVKSIPGDKVAPFNIESEKRARFALNAAKKFMRALVNRDSKAVIQNTTQDFQGRFKDSAEMERVLFGPTDPYYSAYDVRALTQKAMGEVEIRVRLYQVERGRQGFKTVEATLMTKEGKTDWNVDSFQMTETDT